MEKNKGWITINRDIEDWAYWDDDAVFSFFIKLLIIANYEDKKWKDGITIKRGCLVTSIEHLCQRTGSGKSKVMRCLKVLKEYGAIKDKVKPNRYHYITICNYNKYQSVGTSVGRKSTNSSTNSSTTTKQIYNKQKNPSSLPAPEGGANSSGDTKPPKDYNPYVIVRDYAREHKDELGILSPDDAATMFSRGFKVSGQLMPDNWVEVFKRFCSIDEGEQYKFYKHLAAGGSYKWS